MNSTTTAPIVAVMSSGALIGPVPADRLTDKGREKRAGNAEHGSENETLRIVRTGREKARDDPCNQPNNDDPQHGRLRVHLSARKCAAPFVSSALRLN